MNPYDSLAESLLFDEFSLACMRGRIPIPRYTYGLDVSGLGFPPAIIPIWSIDSWPGFVGVSRQWFGDDLSLRYVQYFCETQHTIEVGTTASQFAMWLLYEFFANVPDADEVGAFAEAAGICSRDGVRALFEGVTVVEDLVNLPVFSVGTPRVLTHKVGFETAGRYVTSASLEDAIYGQSWAEVWWLINLPGWDDSLVKRGLNVLSAECDDHRFVEMVKLWKYMNLSAGDRANE